MRADTASLARSTTFSGIAYGSSRLFSGQIRQILSWPGSYETYRKVPTCILYEQHDPEEEAKIVSWGLEAKNASVTKGLIKCVGVAPLSLLARPTLASTSTTSAVEENVELTRSSFLLAGASGSSSSSRPSRSAAACPTLGCRRSPSARTSSTSSPTSCAAPGGTPRG